MIRFILLTLFSAVLCVSTALAEFSVVASDKSNPVSMSIDFRIDTASYGDFDIYFNAAGPYYSGNPYLKNGYRIGVHPSGSDNPNGFICKYIDGVGVTLIEEPNIIQAGSNYTLRVERTSDLIKVFIDNNLFMQVSDDLYQSGDIVVRTWGSVWWDNFQIESINSNYIRSEFNWTYVADQPESIRDAGIAIIDGKVYFAAGGFVPDASPYARNSLWIYDIGSSIWSSGPNLAQRRRAVGSGVIINDNGEEEFYVIGGYSGYSGLSSVERYTPATGAWETVAPRGFAGELPAVAVVDNKLYAMGGHNNNSTCTSLNQVYDRASNSWITLAPIQKDGETYELRGAATVALGNKIYLFGGLRGVGYRVWETLYTTLIYDTVSDSWSAGADTPRSISTSNKAVAFEDQIYVFSIPDGTNTIVEVYDVTKDQWFEYTDFPVPNFRFTNVEQTDDMVLVTGGDYSGIDLSQCWFGNLQQVLSEYPLVVEDGSGDGLYLNGAEVAITADVRGLGYTFSHWTVEPSQYSANFADVLSASTFFVMPEEAVTVTANYISSEFNWTYKTDLPSHIPYAASAIISNSVYFAGGAVIPSVSPWAYNTLWIYDIISSTWSAGPTLAQRRYAPGSGVLINDSGEQEFYVVGGYSGYTGLASVERYVPSLDSWQTVASRGFAGESPCVAVTGNKLYAMGGHNNNFNCTSLNQVYDRASNSWITLAPIQKDGETYEMSGASTAVLNDKIYLLGGHRGDGSHFEDLYTTLIYDTINDSWSYGAETPRLILTVNKSVTFEDRIYVFSIPDGTNTVIDVYDPATDQWFEYTGFPVSNFRFTNVAQANDRVLISGGDMDDTQTFQCWLGTFTGVPQKFTLAVENGNGSGSYAAGNVVDITADEAVSGYGFSHWTVSPITYTNNVASLSDASTEFLMPDENVTLSASYVEQGVVFYEDFSSFDTNKWTHYAEYPTEIVNRNGLTDNVNVDQTVAGKVYIDAARSFEPASRISTPVSFGKGDFEITFDYEWTGGQGGAFDVGLLSDDVYSYVQNHSNYSDALVSWGGDCDALFLNWHFYLSEKSIKLIERYPGDIYQSQYVTETGLIAGTLYQIRMYRNGTVVGAELIRKSDSAVIGSTSMTVLQDTSYSYFSISSWDNICNGYHGDHTIDNLSITAGEVQDNAVVQSGVTVLRQLQTNNGSHVIVAPLWVSQMIEEPTTTSFPATLSMSIADSMEQQLELLRSERETFEITGYTISESGYSLVDLSYADAGTSRVAVASMYLFDSSGSMGASDSERLRVDASQRLVMRQYDEDIGAVLDFGTGSTSGFTDTRLLQGFTDDRFALSNAFNYVTDDGGTPMYDSLYESTGYFAQEIMYGDYGRWIMLFADGAPDNSYMKEIALERLKNENIPVISVGLGDASSLSQEGQSPDAVQVMQEVANETGGMYIALDSAESAESVFEQIGDCLMDGQVSVNFTLDPLPGIGETVSVTFNTSYGDFVVDFKGPVVEMDALVVEPYFGSDQVDITITGRIVSASEDLTGTRVSVEDPVAQQCVADVAQIDSSSNFVYTTTGTVEDGLYLFSFELEGVRGKVMWLAPVYRGETSDLIELSDYEVPVGSVYYVAGETYPYLYPSHVYAGSDVASAIADGALEFAKGSGRVVVDTGLDTLRDVAGDPVSLVASVGVLTCLVPLDAQAICAASVSYLSANTLSSAAKNTILNTIDEAMPEDEGQSWKGLVNAGYMLYSCYHLKDGNVLDIEGFGWDSAQYLSGSYIEVSNETAAVSTMTTSGTGEGLERISFALTDDNGSLMCIALEPLEESAGLLVELNTANEDISSINDGESVFSLSVDANNKSVIPDRVNITCDDQLGLENGHVYNLLSTAGSFDLDAIQWDLSAIDLVLPDGVNGCLRVRDDQPGQTLQLVVTDEPVQEIILCWGEDSDPSYGAWVVSDSTDYFPDINSFVFDPNGSYEAREVLVINQTVPSNTICTVRKMFINIGNVYVFNGAGKRDAVNVYFTTDPLMGFGDGFAYSEVGQIDQFSENLDAAVAIKAHFPDDSDDTSIFSNQINKIAHVIGHEVGHTFGLMHYDPEPEINVMSYEYENGLEFSSQKSGIIEDYSDILNPVIGNREQNSMYHLLRHVTGISDQWLELHGLESGNWDEQEQQEGTFALQSDLLSGASVAVIIPSDQYEANVGDSSQLIIKQASSQSSFVTSPSLGYLHVGEKYRLLFDLDQDGKYETLASQNEPSSSGDFDALTMGNCLASLSLYTLVDSLEGQYEISGELRLRTYVDQDKDSLPDVDEQRIIDSDLNDGLDSLEDVLPGDDFDDDGLNNLDEMKYGTGMDNVDSDSDGIPDGDEVNLGRDPSGNDNTADSDVDNDGLPDVFEVGIINASGSLFATIYDVLPNDNFDGDALNNVQEYERDSDPTVADAFSVTFDLGDHCVRIGGGELSQVVLLGNSAAVPLTQVEEGWAFVNWVGNYDNVDGNRYIIANCIFEKYDSGDGSFASPYRISSKQHLINLIDNTSDYEKCFILTADIDMTGQAFIRAVIAPNAASGTTYSGTPFSGVIDGNGCVIRNVSISTSGSSESFMGLFGKLDGAEIYDLGVENITITDSSNTSRYIGGFCGQNSGSVISGCYVDSVTIQGGSYMGGFCGLNSYSGEIYDCYATGTLTGSGTAGGFCGYNYQSGSIENSYAACALTSSGTKGGFCAGADATGTATGCYWDADVSALATSSGGRGRTTVQMQTQSTFTGWDFASLWSMSGYPVLTCFGGSEGNSPADIVGATIYVTEGGDVEEMTFAETTFEIIDPVHGNETGTYTYTKTGTSTATVRQDMDGSDEYDILDFTFLTDASGTLEVRMYDGVDPDPYHTENVEFTLEQTASGGANDNFADALTLTGDSGQTSGDNTGFSKESGEPDHPADPGGKSAWWKWTAPSDGTVVFNTFGSVFDTILAVYTGDAVDQLTELDANDDAEGDLQSEVGLFVNSGTVYYILVDGYDAESGEIVLNWSFEVFSASGQSPDNLINTTVFVTEDGDVEEMTFGDTTFTIIDPVNGNETGIYTYTKTGTSTATVRQDMDGSTEYDILEFVFETDTSGMVEVRMYDGEDPDPYHTELVEFTLQNASYSGGSGTEFDPYVLGSAADLLSLAVGSEDYDGHFILSSNIDMTGQTFTRAVIAPNSASGTTYSGTPFSGVIDGNGCVIRNVSISTSGSSESFLGLFGKLDGAEIYDLGVENITITDSSNTSRYIGGFCGQNSGSVISGCYVDGVTIQGGSYMGGFCGLNSYSGEIYDCYATGTLTGSGTAGGFCGYNYQSGAIENSYAACALTSSGTKGGFCAGADATGTATGCYWDADVSALATSSGGRGRTTVQMQIQSTFTGWDFSSLWSMSGYPVLTSFGGSAGNSPADIIGATIYVTEGGDVEEMTFAETTFEIIDPAHGNETGTYTYTKTGVSTATVRQDMDGGTEYDMLYFTFLTDTSGTLEVRMYDGVDPDPYHTENVEFTLEQTASGGANDNFADALTLTGNSGQTSGDNTGFSKEVGEPDHPVNEGGKSAWWMWSAPADGALIIDTFGCGMDTLLAVYTGSGLSQLTRVADNDDSGNDVQSAVGLVVSAGTTYWIMVDGYGAEAGEIALNWSFEQFDAAGGAPADIVGNTVLVTEDGDTEEMTFGATTFEIIDPVHGNETGSYTYTRTGTRTATVRQDMDGGEDFDILDFIFMTDASGIVEVRMYTDDLGIPDRTELVEFSLQGPAYSGGSGTEADPYILSSAADLLLLAASSADYVGYFILSCDIDMTGQAFTRAVIAPNSASGTTYSGTPFSGVIDGNGHVIRNVAISTTGSNESFLGLFGKLDGAEISNLGVENITITDSSNTSRYIGGLCGQNSGAMISSCYVDGITIQGGSYMGGFCGLNSYSGAISDCYSTGSLNGSAYAGGFCGYNYQSGSVENSYAVCTITSAGTKGGFCAGADATGTATGCFWDTTVSGMTASSGGTGKTTTEMQQQATYSDWDFTDIWCMDGYPALNVFGGLSFASWLNAESVPAGLCGESDIPMADGVPNLLKYACGLPAMTPVSTADLLSITTGVSGSFSIQYYRSKSATGVTLEPVWSSSLSGPWQSTGVTKTLVGGDAQREQWKASVPLGESGFIKLRATAE